MNKGKLVSLFALFLISTQTLNAQNKLNVTVRKDSVFNDDKFEFFASERSSGNKTLMLLRAPDSSVQALLYMIPQADTVLFIGKFNQLNRIYECKYPKFEPPVIYESYVRNKVMVDGKANLEGLKAYCAERKIELKEIPKRQVARPGINESDSVLKARADEKMKAMVQIEIVNNAKVPVTVMSGMPAKTSQDGKRVYSEKREETFAPGEKKTFIAFKDEVICLITPDKSEKDCHTVTHTMKNLSIATTGDKFGQ